MFSLLSHLIQKSKKESLLLINSFRYTAKNEEETCFFIRFPKQCVFLIPIFPFPPKKT